MKQLKQLAGFVLTLTVGLGLLVWFTYLVLSRTTRSWSEGDVDLRSRLAVESARQSLLRHWSDHDKEALSATLTDMTRDERIMGSIACAEDGTTLAASQNYPKEFSCASLLGRMSQEGALSEKIPDWSVTSELLGGSVRVNALRVEAEPAGYVILFHDLSFVSRRETKMGNQLLIAFLALALGASIFSIAAARLAWRGWLIQLRSALTGKPSRDFRPLVRDVRALVERLSLEREGDLRGAQWNPDRLRSVLKQFLQGERVVVVANREPYIHEKTEEGIKILHPASGLVTALEPVMRACSGVWVAHGSGSADKETVDKNDHIRVPPHEESYVVRRVWLSAEEEAGYYYGFANEGLWPLCHVAHTRPEFHSQDWEFYKSVNQKFADAACSEVDTDDPIILVQDYHFALVPRMIREKLPKATILMFWHIPWPNPESLGICPWREEILEGMLGASILGFHTQQHCNNFLDAIDTFIESRIDRESNAVVHNAQRTLVRPYPISIEWPVRWLAQLPSVEECRREVFEQLHLPNEIMLGVGIDRLDYTKGIEERLNTVDRLLERYPEFRGRFVFVQLAAPSRTSIPRYQELNKQVELLAENINQKWSHGSYHPVILLRAHHEPPAVFRFFRASDLCYVSSLHDGMNLVAKEFVASRDDERGVLVLSQFTGAAKELTEALIVNPYDLQQASDAMASALKMPIAEQVERMRAMRALLSQFNVYRWAGRMLIDAAQLRQRERLSGRLSQTNS